MSAAPLAIHRTGLITAVGVDAPSCCAAFRAKVGNPSPTSFMDSSGDWIMAHQVAIGQPEGHSKLARMAATVACEALALLPKPDWRLVPLLLCVAEKERPGRTEGLDDRLLDEVQELLGVRFDGRSAVLAQGRVAVAVALARARELVDGGLHHVLILAVDSLLNWATLARYDRSDRLLRQDNSNGFMPGEGAGALLVGRPTGRPQLLCTGLGFAIETAHVDSELSLRGEGLAAALRQALSESGQVMHDFDYRIADLSGELYYFKEASLALSRTLHRPKEEFDLWHPAECTGEAGSLAGAAIISLAESACRKGFGAGPNIVAHLSNDGGSRAALLLQFRGA